MTLARRLVVSFSVGLVLVAGGVIGATAYYDSVPLVEPAAAPPGVAVEELPPPVANAFVAAVDPAFFTSGDSLITRRYAVIAHGAGEESSLRTAIMARKAEAAYTKAEILDRYLNRADFGQGSVGLVAAAQTWFQKPAPQLTVPEAALLAVQLHPDRPGDRVGWEQVLDTMAERGWLSQTERNGLFFPG